MSYLRGGNQEHKTWKFTAVSLQPVSHWWEAGAVATVLYLIPQNQVVPPPTSKISK